MACTNESITISGVCVKNVGGLTLPPGAVVLMPQTEGISFYHNEHAVLDGLEPGQSYTIPCTFNGRISDSPPPKKPGPLNKRLTVNPRVELLGRPFPSENGLVLDVCYPLQFGRLKSPKLMGRGEIAVLAIEVKNTSKIACVDVLLNLHFDARILPLATTHKGPVVPHHTITYDPRVRDSLYVQVPKVLPKKSTAVTIVVQMERQAEFGDKCLLQADLYYKSKLIEYRQWNVEVSPSYIPQNPSADVLLVSKQDFPKREFEFWDKILSSLEVSVDYWDLLQQRGFSVDADTGARHKTSWFGNYAGKMILFPHCQLKFLLGVDIAMHFHGPQFRVGSLKEHGSSMVLFMDKEESDFTSVLKHLSLVNKSRASSCSGSHFFRPLPNQLPPPYEKPEEK